MLVSAVFAGQTYNLVNLVVILASNETKTSERVMSLELWIFSEKMYRETIVPICTHSKFLIDHVCYFLSSSPTCQGDNWELVTPML